MKMVKNAPSLRQNNSGSAMITVIVTMLMVIALGAALLFGAYTSYKIALTQRADSKNFYTAESAMDDLRSGVQEKVSAALTAAYTKTLESYAESDGAEFDFQTQFAANFSAALITDSSFYTAKEKYSAAALRAFIDEARLDGASCTVGGGGEMLSEGKAELTAENGVLTAITLKAVTLKWIKDGFEADISTDIVISVPGFSRNLGEFALVAQSGIVQEGAKGSVISGTVFTGGDIDVKSGSLELNGDAYVGDDLLLSGSAASAKLTGQYVGFGSSDKDPEHSSAIIVNGKGSRLDISGLSQLTLSGISFIDVISPNTYENSALTTHFSNAVPMGQSMAFKANQLAYLVPAECVENYPSNPCILSTATTLVGETATTSVIEPTVNTDAVLWDKRPLSYYLKDGKGSVKTLYKNLDGGNEKIGYVFLVFNTKAAANEYFRDYFEHYPDRIAQYLDFYLTSFNSVESGAVSAAGNVFSKDADGSLTLIKASPAVAAAGRRFDDFVNTHALNKLPQNTAFSFTYDGSKAVVINGNYTSTGDEKLIISSGDVTLGGTFSGTALAQGTVTLSNTSSKTAVTAASVSKGLLTAKSGAYTLSDFLQAGYGGELDGSNQWAAEKLVVYENWSKN